MLLIYILALIGVALVFLGARKLPRRATALTCLLAILGLTGCLAESVKIAHRRAESYAKSKGDQGDPLGAAVGKEMEEANKTTGADQIPADAAPLDVQAAENNAVEIMKDREAARSIRAFFQGLLENISSHVPVIGTAVGGLLAIGEALRRLWKKKRALAGSLNSIQALKDAARDGEGLSLKKMKALLTAARNEGPELVAGGKELMAEYRVWRSAREAARKKAAGAG